MKFAIKTLVILLILAGGYFFILKTKISTEKKVMQEYNNLVQNRISYIALMKIDPTSPSAGADKTDILAKIKETNKIGLESENKDVREVMKIQNEILEELVTLKTFEEGVELLKSEKSVEFLTKLTNIIKSEELRIKN